MLASLTIMLFFSDFRSPTSDLSGRVMFMELRIIDITKDLITTKPYPGDPAPELSVFSSISGGDSCNMAMLTTTLHAGTHADAPLHFLDNGASVNNVPLEKFIGECRVVEIPADMITGAVVDEYFPKGEKKILIKSGGKAFFEKTGAEAAAYLGYDLIGIDSNSIGSPADQKNPHRAILGEGIAVLENLDLSQVKAGKYFLAAFPLKIQGVEASPVRAVLLDGYLFWSN